MRVLAIDPGERVGWARAELLVPRDDDRSRGGLQPIERTLAAELVLEDHGIAGLRDFATTLAQRIAAYDIVIFEEYRISATRERLMAHVGSDVPTLQLIGMIRLCAWLNPGVKLVKQRPADKTTAKKSLNHPGIEIALKKMPKSHDDAHDGDALLHLWHWFWKEYV